MLSSLAIKGFLNWMCMDYSNDPVPNQHPNKHDYDQLVTIYTHLDSTTTVAASSAAPPAMNGIDGRAELYELDFGNGHKVFTFVTWTEEAVGRGKHDR